MAEKDDGREFRVEDRRRFHPEGREAEHREGIELPGGGVLQTDPGQPEQAWPVGFEDLVRPFLLMGLASLGLIPHPESGQPQVSLAGARAAIELLELLQRKTEGQRTPDETRLLDETLLELKMQYVGARERG
ncbi:MAG: DUF1844 domain-containing protein [Acidobacteria bacterium]|nr:DUF1844 domain-containing protein [Acidobacteriota bacterium]